MNNLDLVAAIRTAYRVVWFSLPTEKAVDHVRNIASAWRGGIRSDIVSALGCLQFDLSNTVGAYRAYAEIRSACVGLF